jgi:hypothetical protein
MSIPCDSPEAAAESIPMRCFVLIGVAFLAVPELAVAQSDEIQVYDGGLAAPGIFNLTVHNNFTPKGLTTPAFPGGIVADKSFNGVPEFAFGVTDWFEAGLYLPLYSRDKDTGWQLDGFKVRALFAAPHAGDRRFVYGVNFELSYNARRWDPQRITSEIRPIVGWHFKPVDIIINPILDTSYDGFENLEVVPAVRFAHNFSSGWAAALEEYADFGPLHALLPGAQQTHQLYGVLDHAGKTWEVELGVGVGLTSASDRLTFKLILARDLSKKEPARRTPVQPSSRRTRGAK